MHAQPLTVPVASCGAEDFHLTDLVSIYLTLSRAGLEPTPTGGRWGEDWAVEVPLENADEAYWIIWGTDEGLAEQTARRRIGLP